MQIDIQGVKITLTQSQLEEIARQTKKQLIIEDVHDYPTACNILGISIKSNISVYEEINTIAKAMNFIENGSKLWIIDWDNTNEYKYCPYHKYQNGWFFSYSRCYFYGSGGPVAFLKTQKASNLLGTKFLHLFIKMYNNY